MNDYGVILVTYNKLQQGELSKKQFVQIVKTQVKKSPFLHIGTTGAGYYQYKTGTFNPQLKEHGQKKDALWLSGNKYDFMFIRFEKASQKQVITFLKAAHKRSTHLIRKERMIK